MNADTILEWEITPPDWVVLRALVYGRFALFYGFFVFILGGVVAFVMLPLVPQTEVVIFATSVVTVASFTAFLSVSSEPTRERIGQYVTVAGSQSGSVFEYWKPTTLTTLALVGAVSQQLLWTTGAIPTVVLVGVPIAARLVEEIFVALVPLAGSIDRSSATYTRRVDEGLESQTHLEFDLSARTLEWEWSIGEVTCRWYTGDGPPLLVPVPNEVG